MVEFELNFETIVNEIMALTALRKVTSATPEAGMLVTHDQLPGLRVLGRMVFAEMVMMLGDAVAASSIDEADVAAEHPYNAEEAPRMRLTIAGAEGMDGGKLIALRRTMEHAVAAGILQWVATESDGEFAKKLAAQRAGAMEAVAQAIQAHTAGTPRRLCGWPPAM